MSPLFLLGRDIEVLNIEFLSLVTMVKNFLLRFSRSEKVNTCYEYLNVSRRNMDSQRTNSTT
jgi:hypothetical protein